MYSNENIIPDIFSRKHDARHKNQNTLNDQKASGMLPREARTKVTAYLSDNHNEILSAINDDETKKSRVKDIIQSYCVDEGIRISDLTLNETVDMLYKDIIEYSFLTDLIFDETHYEEIRVNDYNDIRAVINGKEYPYEKVFDSPDQLYTIVQKMCQNVKAEKVIRPDTPFVRLRLGNNTRVSIMANPVARRPVGNNSLINSPVVQMVIRKQRSKPFEKTFLLKNGTLDEYSYKLILLCLQGKVSMAFYGGTNSGKTATMASIAQNIAAYTRTITIAEIDEMNLRRVDEKGKSLNNTIMWEMKPQIDGMDMERCVNASLTFTPETLITQEIKGAETVAVIDASITGHQVLVTLHADNIGVFEKRILGMYKQRGSDLSDNLILDYVVDAFPLAVRMKIYPDGKRRVADISEILSYDRHSGKFKTNVLYEFEVEDNTVEELYDEYLNKVEKTTVTKGKHVPRSQPSENLGQ